MIEEKGDKDKRWEARSLFGTSQATAKEFILLEKASVSTTVR